jgi:hypothetical protein
MDHKAFRQYVQAVAKRYHSSGKRQKGVILDELSATAGLNRNYATRLMNNGHKRKRAKSGRKSKYSDPEFRLALRRVWSAAHYLCGKLLKVAIPRYLPFYDLEYGSLEAEHKEKILAISAASIDRVLRPEKAKHGKSMTRPGSMLREEIPIRTDYWSNVSPGFMEGDSVAHCGGSMKGPFIWTITFIDIATTWVETRAVWTLNGDNTVEAIRDMRKSLPFGLIALDFDNGGEFMNNVVVYFCSKEGIALTRSRPYRKNDNAHVEQKNNSVVRQLMGYGRFENPTLVSIMNDLYRKEWNYFNNFFRPSFKLKVKTRIGSKYSRKYDTPMTPYDRVLESPAVGEERKQQLREFYATLNPFELRKSMDLKVQQIKKLSRVTFDDWQQLHAQTPSLHLPF